MKKRDRQALQDYVRWCANEIGLRDWTITLNIGDPDEEIDRYDAEHIKGVMECVNGRKLGVLTVPPAIRRDDLEEVRNTIVHELVHCHLSPLWGQITHLMNLVGRPATDGITHGIEMDLERAVDAIATEWARHLPLIAWPR